MKRVNLVEVGPRDGLQGIKKILSSQVKATYINMLIDAGITNIEIGSFVSNKVPQMQNTDEVMKLVTKNPNVKFIALVPNKTYAARAIQSGINELAVFTTISEQFSLKNSNCTIDQSLRNIREIIELALIHNVSVRGYISCAFGCPYEGYQLTYPFDVKNMAKYLIDIGCSSISIADTIGTATPKMISDTIGPLLSDIDPTKIGIHLHDTHGNAIENMKQCIEMGITTFDCASGGLGGCPFATGAPGNISTEITIDLLDSLGMQHGINRKKVRRASQYIFESLDLIESQNTKSKL